MTVQTFIELTIKILFCLCILVNRHGRKSKCNCPHEHSHHVIDSNNSIDEPQENPQ
jgi:hypothetical protein